MPSTWTIFGHGRSATGTRMDWPSCWEVVSLGVLLSIVPDAPAWEPVLIGAVIASAFLVMGVWLSLRRFVVLGLIGFAVVAALGMGKLAAPVGIAVYLLVVGSALLVSGTLALGTFVRRTRPPAEAQ